MELRKAFRFRIYPNKSQEKFFLQMAGARRFVWNWALNKRIEFYKENKKSLSFLQISKDLTELKKQPETAWLKEMSASSLQQALRDLEKAFKNFFEKRAGFPKWDCKKSGRVRFRIPAGVSIRGNKLFVPKVGLVKVRVHRIVDGIIKSATFKKDTCNHWYVTLVSEFQMPDMTL